MQENEASKSATTSSEVQAKPSRNANVQNRDSPDRPSNAQGFPLSVCGGAYTEKREAESFSADSEVRTVSVSEGGHKIFSEEGSDGGSEAENELESDFSDEGFILTVSAVSRQ